MEGGIGFVKRHEPYNTAIWTKAGLLVSGHVLVLAKENAQREPWTMMVAVADLMGRNG